MCVLTSGLHSEAFQAVGLPSPSCTAVFNVATIAVIPIYTLLCTRPSSRWVQALPTFSHDLTLFRMPIPQANFLHGLESFSVLSCLFTSLSLQPCSVEDESQQPSPNNALEHTFNISRNSSSLQECKFCESGWCRQSMGSQSVLKKIASRAWYVAYRSNTWLRK